jgi:DNA-binding MarR family transcriptional regulator
MQDAAKKPASPAISSASGKHSFANQPDMALEVVELLFFAYRDFISDADSFLETIGYGRAHHRVLHFVTRHPGMRVADLLEVLAITKQSLNRVLRQLLDDDYVTQRAGPQDRRERRLHLTPKGLKLSQHLMQLQTARVAAALEKNDLDPRPFLRQIIDDKNRQLVGELLLQGAPKL